MGRGKRYAGNIRRSLSHEAKQARYNDIYFVLKAMRRNKRYTCNIHRSLSHEAKQELFIILFLAVYF